MKNTETEAAKQMHTCYAARAPYYDDVYLKPERREVIALMWHRVLKNFPTESELATLLCAYSDKVEYTKLQNFWMVTYEIR